MVFVGLFAVLSVLDCFLGEDGWYLVDLKQAQDAKHYFGMWVFIVLDVNVIGQESSCYIEYRVSQKNVH